MDSVIMQVSCPGCNAVFELPSEVAGQAGECTECGTIFEIPTLEEMGLSVPETPQPQAAAPAPAQAPAHETSANLSKQAVGAGKELADIGETTNTIKLSRSSIGMVPDLSGKDDGFKVDIVQKASQSQTNIDQQVPAPASAPGPGQRKFSKTRTSMQKNKRSAAKKAQAEAPEEKPQKAKKPWWQFWMFWK